MKLTTKLILLGVGASLVACGNVETNAYLAIPSYDVLRGQIVQDADFTDQTEALPENVAGVDLAIRYADGTRTDLDLLDTVKECEAEECVVPIPVRPGLDIAFDLQVHNTADANGGLVRRGVTIATVAAGADADIVIVMRPTKRVASGAVTGGTTAVITHVDVIQQPTSALFVLDFDQAVGDPLYGAVENVLAGRMEFSFPVSKDAVLFEPVTGLETVSHIIPFTSAGTCQHFPLAPVEAGLTATPEGCDPDLKVEGLPIAYMPYQVYGDAVYIRLPYDAIGTDTEVLGSSFAVALQDASGGVQKVPASGGAALR